MIEVPSVSSRRTLPKNGVWISAPPCSISPFRPTIAALPKDSTRSTPPSASLTRSVSSRASPGAIRSTSGWRSATRPRPAHGLRITAAAATRRTGTATGRPSSSSSSSVTLTTLRRPRSLMAAATGEPRHDLLREQLQAAHRLTVLQAGVGGPQQQMLQAHLLPQLGDLLGDVLGGADQQIALRQEVERQLVGVGQLLARLHQVAQAAEVHDPPVGGHQRLLEVGARLLHGVGHVDVPYQADALAQRV